MKKKLIIAAAVFCTILVAMLIIARLSGMLQIFSVPTISNEPNIKVGNKIFSSNLKSPRPYHFIVFTNAVADSINMVTDIGIEAGSRYVHRLCALPGDKIEMKNGVLFVNDRNFDDAINLFKPYKITSQEFYSISDDDMNTLTAIGRMQMISQDSAIVSFDSKLLKKYKSTINCTPYIETSFNFGAFKWNGKNESWTIDNFGPLQIPADCYFVLGDNRHNALDSRYIGFVKKENIKAVVLNK